MFQRFQVNPIFNSRVASLTNNLNSSQSYFNPTLLRNNVPNNPRQPDFATTGFFSSVKNNVTKLVNRNLGFLPFSPPKLPSTFSSSAPSTSNIRFKSSKQNQPNGNSEPEGRNWRMLKLFSGRLNEDLPPDCECPQNNEDKEFPFPECHTEDLFRSSPLSPSDDEEEVQPVKRMKSPILDSKKHASMTPCSSESLNKFLKPSTVATLSSLNLPTTNNSIPVISKTSNNSFPGTSKTSNNSFPGTSKASNNSIPGTSKTSTIDSLPLELNTNLVNSKTTSKTASKSISPNQQRGHQQPPWRQQQQQQTINGKKRFINKSLLILKSGKRVYAGSKECYQFAETGACQAGIFCIFEHDKSLDHIHQKVCQRLLRGVCRGTGDDCPGGLHSPLLPHQMPVCDFYLRLVCSKGKDECNYLHVRHTPGTEPCAEFNRGCCHRGILVCFSRFSNFSIQLQNDKTTGANRNGQEKEAEDFDSAPSPPSPIKSLRWIS
uniref:C3H1-type domain-containing protein n=1 Tax=Meloidogyne hapla TaxID=6305 RepID=A0A1I8BMZ7_MELHA